MIPAVYHLEYRRGKTGLLDVSHYKTHTNVNLSNKNSSLKQNISWINRIFGYYEVRSSVPSALGRVFVTVPRQDLDFQRHISCYWICFALNYYKLILRCTMKRLVRARGITRIGRMCIYNI
jgi:hypothetical protein